MSRFILEISSSHSAHNTLKGRHVVEGKSIVTLGRGYHCDVILDDPYVSKSHVKLVRTEKGIAAKDLDSKNGTRYKKRLLKDKAVLIPSGEFLHIGRTKIRVFEHDHDIEKTLKLKWSNALRERLNNKFISAALLIIASLLYVMFAGTYSTAINYWDEDVYSDFMISVASVVGIAFLIAIPYFLKHKSPSVTMNVSIVGIYVALFSMLSFARDYTSHMFLDYSFQMHFYASLFAIMTFLSILAYGHINDGKATKSNWFLAIVVAVFILGVDVIHIWSPDESEALGAWFSDSIPGHYWEPDTVRSIDQFLSDAHVVYTSDS